jgi:hypothetical protein
MAMSSDAGGRLSSDPFGWARMKNGSILISRGGRIVTTVRGSEPERLLRAIAAAENDRAVQQLLARATGNYRRGNERHETRP